MESTEKMLEQATVSLSNLDICDMSEILKHMPDVSIDEILDSHSLYKLALIYASKGSHHKLIRKVAIAGIGFRDTDENRLKPHNEISTALKENDFDALQKLLENESTSALVMEDKLGYDLITSVLLCGCSAEFLEFMFKQFAVVNRSIHQLYMINSFNSRGLTPLISAVLGGNLACVQSLLKKGADVDLSDTRCVTDQFIDQSEKTEHKSSSTQETDKKSFPKDILFGSCKSALMYATCIGNSECVEILLKFKPDLKKKCLSGLTAHSYAAITSSYKCLELLLTTPVQMDMSELMGNAGKSGRRNSAKSCRFSMEDSFNFTVTEDDKTKAAILEREKKAACLKRKKDDFVKKVVEEETNSSHNEDSQSQSDENDNDTHDEDDQSDDHRRKSDDLRHKSAHKTPVSFDFSEKSTPVSLEIAPNKEKTTKDNPFSFNFGIGDIQPKFTIGEFTPKTGFQNTKIKSKAKHRTKREGNAHKLDFMKQLLDTNGENSHDMSNVRAIAEASLPFAIQGDDIKCLKLLLNHCGNLGCKDKFGKTPLMLAAERGKTDYVKLLLENWAGVDSPVSLGMQETSLMLAAQNGHSECVSILLQHNANVGAVNWCKETALMYAAKKGSVECLKILLEHKANVHSTNTKEQSSLTIAVENGNTECIKLLLEHGSVVHNADWCRKSVLMYAAETGNAEILDMMLKAVIKQNEMSIASTCSDDKQTESQASAASTSNDSGQVDSNRSEVAFVFGSQSNTPECRDEKGGSESNTSECRDEKGGLESNTSECSDEKEDLGWDTQECSDWKKVKTKVDDKEVNTEKKEKLRETITLLADNALPYSVIGGNMKCIELLLPHCKNHNQPEYLGKKTALMLAAEKGQLEWVKLLIKHGADVNFVSEVKGNYTGEKGFSAVVCATLAKSEQCLQFLLENGADANVGFNIDKMVSKQNAVAVATRNLDNDCLKILLKYKADVTIEDSDGSSALMYALANKDDSSCLMTMINAGVRIELKDYYEDEKFKGLFVCPENLEILLKEGGLVMGKSDHEPFFDDRILTNIREPHTIAGLQLIMKYGLFDWRVWCNDYNYKEILFCALSAGISPQKCVLRDKWMSPFQFALSIKSENVFRYLLSNLYFTFEDYVSFTEEYTNPESSCTPKHTDSDSDNSSDQEEEEQEDKVWFGEELEKTLCHNPWRLETLCLLTISSSLCANNTSSCLPRTTQVECLPIPRKFKTILEFSGPYSNLCVQEWDQIARPISGPVPDILCVTRPSYPLLNMLSDCNDSCCAFRGVGVKIGTGDHN